MKVQFYAKNVEIPARLKADIEDRLQGIKKYKGSVSVLNVQVDISRDQHHRKGDVYRVEVNADLPGKLLRAVETGGDILAALDAVAKKLERQARDVKEKSISQKKRGSTEK